MDSDAALSLARRIEASPEAKTAGLEVWIDKVDLGAGGAWKAVLETALENATAFVVYVGSRGILNWVQAEVGVALDRAMAEPSFPLVSVLPEGVDPKVLPGFLSQHQAISNVERDGEAFNRLLRAVLRMESRAGVLAVDRPFIGLQAFDSRDAHLFFGRKEETSALVERLRRQHLVMVRGNSGSGKSSLVKAGLVPAFLGGQLGIPRAQGLDRSVWRVIETRPGNDPFRQLADDLRNAALAVRLTPGDASDLAAMIRPDRNGVLPSPDRVRDALLSCLPPDLAAHGKFLLVVDQFEEFRTSTVAIDYVSTLLHLADPQDDRIRVVLTMRRDYYFACASFPSLYARLEADDRAAIFSVERIDRKLLPDVVTEPLKLTLTPELQRKALAAAVARDAGDEAGELPVIQFALNLTWAHRADHGGDLVTTYQALGRAEGALAQEAERIYLSLSPDEQRHAETLFVRLVRPGEVAGVTRRIARLGEFDAATQALADKLSRPEQSRLLTLGDGTVEISHEQLATQWSRYQGWISNIGADLRGDDLRVLQLLTEGAAAWERRGEREADLARGGALEAFSGLRDRRALWLASSEARFVDMSDKAALKERDRQRQEKENLQKRVKLERAVASNARRQVWGAMVALVLLVLVAGFAWWQRDEAVTAQQHLGRQLIAYEDQRIRRLISAAQQETSAGDAVTGIALMTQALQPASTPVMTRPVPRAWQILHDALATQREQRVIHTTNRVPKDLAWSPDSDAVATVFIDGSLEIRVLSSDLIAQVKGDNEINTNPDYALYVGATSIDWSRSGKELLISFLDGSVEIWDVSLLSRPIKLQRFKAGDGSKAWFSPDGQRLSQTVTGREQLTFGLAMPRATWYWWRKLTPVRRLPSRLGMTIVQRLQSDRIVQVFTHEMFMMHLVWA